MAQTKSGFITLTDVNDGTIGVDGNTYITHTAYQNYVPGTAVSLPPAMISLGSDGVLDNNDLTNGWVITPSTPTGSSATFFTTRIFKQTAGTGNFVGQGTVWSNASRLTGDDGRPGDPGVSNTGRYSDLQTSEGFVTTSANSGRWKILTDDGDIPNANDGVDQWTTSVNVLFLADEDENGAAISDYYGTLQAGDLGRLQVDAEATPSSANIPSFCTIPSGTVESAPFICDSPAGYVVFTLLEAPERMTPTGTASDTGVVWRMSIRTDRADTAPTLDDDSSVVANFGYNKVVQGADGIEGDTGSRGAGRFDRSFTVTTAVAPVAGSSVFNQAARCAVSGGYPFDTAGTISCNSKENNTGSAVSLVTPVEGDVVVLTVTESDGDTATSGGIHNGEGVADNFWSGFTVQIDGSLLVSGSVVASAIRANSITADQVNLQPSDVGVGSSSGSGSRMVITNESIKIYDDSSTLRVVLGNLA